MHLITRNITLILTLAVGLILTFYFSHYRWLGYERIPTVGNFDEFNYVFQGMSIRSTGVPVGWSDSSAYNQAADGKEVGLKIQDFTIRANNESASFFTYHNFPKPVVKVDEHDIGTGLQHIKLVMPFIDHPPVGGLILSLGVSGDSKTFFDINSDQFRKASLYLAGLTSILILIFATLISGNLSVGILSLIIYNTVPTYVLATRYGLLENVLAPFVLIHLILLFWSKKISDEKRSFHLLILSAFFAGLSILIKETALGFVLGSILVLFLWQTPKKKISTFIGVIFFVGLLYLSWGMWLDFQLFWQVFLFNASRGYFGSLNLLSILPSLRFEHFPLDGWWIWGFISLLILAIRSGDKYFILTIPILGHLLILMLTSNMNHPTYYLALIPFLSIASGWIMWQIFISPKIPETLAFLLIPLSSSLYWGYLVRHLPPQIITFRILFLISAVFVLLRIFKSENQKIKLAWMIFCAAMLYVILKLNINSITFMIANWGKLPFPSLPQV